MSYRPISRALALLSLMPTLALALPTSPDVQAGGAFLDRVDKATMHITCQDKTVINWDTFSVDSHEALKFIQSADSTVLNRVTGHITGGDISRIMGTLESQGNVYILNPQGIFIGKDATINVGSLIASTLNITNADFFEACNGVKGKRGEEGLKEASVLFSGDSQAKVLNLGTIKASSGDVHVIAYEIDNQGKIEAAKGQVSLNACQEAILQPASNRRVLIKAKVGNVQKETENNKGKLANAKLSETGVKNTGVIKALEARLGAEGSLYKLAINQSGHIEAKTFVADKGGKIFLTAEKGSIKVDGKMVAGIVTPQSVKARPNKSEKGGYIEVLADSIRLEDKADIDVSGRLGGGTSLIGSDYQGKGMPFNSQHTYIGKGANVTASAWGNGNGGKIIFWGDESIEFLGNVTAKGGPNGGNGGFVEVSSPGKQPGAFKVGGLVSTLAPKGKVGTLLWDPATIDIQTAGGNLNITEDTGTPDEVTYTPTDPGVTANLTPATIEAHLAGNDVIIDASSGGNDSIITVRDSVTWATEHDLTFKTSGSGCQVDFLASVIGSDSESKIRIESQLINIGSSVHDHTSTVNVSAGSIEVQLNADSGQLGVFSGDGDGIDGLLTATSGTVSVTEASDVTGGYVFIESQILVGAETGDAIIQGTTGVDIGMNFDGSGNQTGHIEIDSFDTKEAAIKNTGAGDIKLYCRRGDIVLNATGGTGSRAYIETASGPITYSTTGSGGSDIGDHPMRGIDIDVTNGSEAFIKATADIDFGFASRLFYNEVSLTTDTSSSAYIQTTAGSIHIDVENTEVAGGNRDIVLDASSGGTVMIDANSEMNLWFSDLDIDANGASAQAYVLCQGKVANLYGTVTLNASSEGKAYIEAQGESFSSGDSLIVVGASLTADGDGSEAYINAKKQMPIEVQAAVNLTSDNGGYTYIGDDIVTPPSAGQGCGKITIDETSGVSKLWSKGTGSLDQNVYIYSKESDIEINPAGGSGAGFELVNEGDSSSKVAIISGSTAATAIDIDIQGNLSLTTREETGATAPETYISGAGGVTVKQSSQVTMSATGEHTKTYITSTQGPVKLGTSSSRIGALDMDSADQGTVYVGDAPDASSAAVTGLEIYSTGNVTLDAAGTDSGVVWIHKYGSTGTTPVIDISSGDLSLNNAGDNYNAEGVQIHANNDDLNITASGAVNISADGYTVAEIKFFSLNLSAESLSITGDGNSNLSGLGCNIETSGNVTVSGNNSILGMSSLVSSITALGQNSDVLISGGGNTYVSSNVGITITAGRDVIVEEEAYLQGSLNSGNTVVIAGREVKVKGTSHIDSKAGNLTIVTDNNYPSPSADPSAGIGNLTLEAGASLKTTGNAGEVRIYAGFDENNRADIADTALINGAAYSTMKGTLDTEDANNYFGVWYNVTTEPGYASPATFYYKETLSSLPIQEEVTIGGDAISSGLISSQTLSSYFGETLLNFLRRSYVHKGKSFQNQYRRAKRPLRRKVMGNKTPSSGDVGPQETSSEPSSGSFKTNTYRTKK